MNALYTIIRPLVTEKATKLGEKFTYAFYVNTKATKIEVKKAIKEMYGQDVATVRMIVCPCKTKVMRRSVVNKRAPMKKALVTLKGKKKLDVTKLVKESKK
jgi:large subunit ribosomal protein L23